jgi:Clp amino terminal domain, pathogenicity island component
MKLRKAVHDMRTISALMKAAEAEARADKKAPLSGAHVIRALSDLEHGTAARALEKLGVDRAELGPPPRPSSTRSVTAAPVEGIRFDAAVSARRDC